MLEKPNLPDDALIECLHDHYGMQMAQLTFLPLGLDVGSAVYRAVDVAGHAYFLKLRRGPVDEKSVLIPALLSACGIAQVIRPLPTHTLAEDGTPRYWGRFTPAQALSAAFTLTLYPFIEGKDGYEVELTSPQWAALGVALKRMHTAALPAALRRSLPQETYSPFWRERVKMFQARVPGSTFDDPIAAELAAFLRGQDARIRELVTLTEQMARTFQSDPPPCALCHADLHAGNLLIQPDGAFYIVDWDTAVLAPKERDLMFVGSGLGPGWDTTESTHAFYEGYGLVDVNAVAVAYYRCERVIQDIAAFCEHILTTTDADASADRRQSLHYLMGSFEPGGVLDIALKSYCAAQAT
jgi:spectinomycin phosphotransferase